MAPEEARHSLASSSQNSERIWDGGDLNLTNGLLVILELALADIGCGEKVILRSSDRDGIADVRTWSRLSGHTLVVSEGGSFIEYEIEKGVARKFLLDGDVQWGNRLMAPDSSIESKGGEKLETGTGALAKLCAVPLQSSPGRGFAPRGAALELHSPAFAFTLNNKREVWASEVADLYDQAVANQWDGVRDIDWSSLPPLPPILERAVCQLMTFLVENEYSALYVPGKFISRINPQYMEVVLFLTTQLMDEARHIEVFTKRALANGGGLQVCTASTEHSLKCLFEQNDFSCASFLLSVLGEGTFVDLLKFIEEVAPDPVTADIVRRARIDEIRHVHFGMAHIRYLLAEDAGAVNMLMRAVFERSLVLRDVTAINELVTQALAILAGGGIEPAQLKVGTARVNGLLKLMDENRRKRLVSIGFSPEQAAEVSALHTPNFM
ncbi:MAG: DUF455 domain-containing protein [Candidatus Melainabacteria bacterium]|nr:DUF455 domain-containing protein [Candidatus Melainabacteria bacterium]